MTTVWVVEYAAEGETHIEAVCSTEEIAHRQALIAAAGVKAEAYADYSGVKVAHYSHSVGLVWPDGRTAGEYWRIFEVTILDYLPTFNLN